MSRQVPNERESVRRSHALGLVLLTALCCSVATSVVHVVIVIFLFHGLSHIVYQSGEFVWAAPLGYLTLFGVAAVPVAALGALFPRVFTRRVVISVFAAMSAVAILLWVPRVHPAALVALGIGAGVRIGFLPVPRPRRIAWRMVAAGLLVLVVAGGTEWAVERHLRSAAGGNASTEARGPGAPNVLLIIWDTARAASMNLYGYARPTTPSLQRLAQESTVYDWAMSAAPWTLPSHASIMTGAAASEQSGNWNTPLDTRQRTLAEFFDAHGYATGGFVANLNYTHTYSGIRRGFTTYREHRHTLAQILLATSTSSSPPPARPPCRDLRPAGQGLSWGQPARRRSILGTDPKLDGVVSDEFLRWQRGLNGRPFFAFSTTTTPTNTSHRRGT